MVANAQLHRELLVRSLDLLLRQALKRKSEAHDKSVLEGQGEQGVARRTPAKRTDLADAEDLKRVVDCVLDDLGSSDLVRQTGKRDPTNDEKQRPEATSKRSGTC